MASQPSVCLLFLALPGTGVGLFRLDATRGRRRALAVRRAGGGGLRRPHHRAGMRGDQGQGRGCRPRRDAQVCDAEQQSRRRRRRTTTHSTSSLFVASPSLRTRLALLHTSHLTFSLSSAYQVFRVLAAPHLLPDRRASMGKAAEQGPALPPRTARPPPPSTGRGCGLRQTTSFEE